MITTLKETFLKFLGGNKYRIQTFTYYIPGPPQRKNGYREKQFDKVMYTFLAQGYKILSIQTQAHTGAEQSGMWVIVTVRATNARANELDLSSSYDGLDKDSSAPDGAQVEGLYQIDGNN